MVEGNGSTGSGGCRSCLEIPVEYEIEANSSGSTGSNCFCSCFLVGVGYENDANESERVTKTMFYIIVDLIVM